MRDLVVTAVVRLVGHHMLVLVRYKRVKLIHAHCHVITSQKLGRCAVQGQQAYVACEEVISQQISLLNCKQAFFIGLTRVGSPSGMR